MNPFRTTVLDRPSGRRRVVIGWIGMVVGAMFVLAGGLTIAMLVLDGPPPDDPRPTCASVDEDGTTVGAVGRDCAEVDSRQ